MGTRDSFFPSARGICRHERLSTILYIELFRHACSKALDRALLDMSLGNLPHFELYSTLYAGVAGFMGQ